jgi:hypothetical protein
MCSRRCSRQGSRTKHKAQPSSPATSASGSSALPPRGPIKQDHRPAYRYEHFRCADSRKPQTCRSGRSNFISRRRMILPERSFAHGPKTSREFSRKRRVMRLGLGRTWKLSERWVMLSGEIGIALEPLGIDEPGSEHAGARCALLESLKGWVEDTRRSLRQAQLRHELKPAANIRATAIEIHQLLWSRSWTSALYGPEASARSILGAIWRHLSALAADPSVALPSLEEVFTEPAPEDEPPEDTSSDPFLPPGSWSSKRRTRSTTRSSGTRSWAIHETCLPAGGHA